MSITSRELPRSLHFVPIFARLAYRTRAPALHAHPTISMLTTAAASQPVCLLPTAAAAQPVCALKCEAPVDAARAPLERVAVLDRSHPMLKRSFLRPAGTAGTGSISTATATAITPEYSATLDRAICNATGPLYDIVDDEKRAFWEEYLSLLLRERALTSAAGFSRKAPVALVKLLFKSSFNSLQFPCHVCLDDSVANVQAHARVAEASWRVVVLRRVLCLQGPAAPVRAHPLQLRHPGGRHAPRDSELVAGRRVGRHEAWALPPGGPVCAVFGCLSPLSIPMVQILLALGIHRN